MTENDNDLKNNIKYTIDRLMRYSIIDAIRSAWEDDKVINSSPLQDIYRLLKQRAVEILQGLEDIDISEYIEKAMKGAWHVGNGGDLPISHKAKWDGSAAKKRIFKWAGFDGDNPSPSKARKAFLLYNSEKPKLKESYKDPIADIIDGRIGTLAFCIVKTLGEPIDTVFWAGISPEIDEQVELVDDFAA